jgi:hypothetical protein
MQKVKLGLRGLTLQEKVEKAKRVESGIRRSNVLKENKKITEDLASARMALEKAMEMAAYGDRRAIAARNLCLKKLEEELRKAAAYVNAYSHGNETVILESGFDLRKRNNQPAKLEAPENFRIKRTENSGELILSWSPVSNSKNYLVQCCQGKSTDKTEWLTIHYSTKSRCVITDLKPGKTYQFRVLAIGAGGIGPPSCTEAIMAA